ncbi:UNVERIFIED_CONTAM: hypothetical protein Sradi_4037500 [Sesamum radiatum]|uniref:RNase H type-1 domain-containing protein n=1 Tax=Sesamum radiatum TaxID=300843 RepID=A0AAW2PK25_SESRA
MIFRHQFRSSCGAGFTTFSQLMSNNEKKVYQYSLSLNFTPITWQVYCTCHVIDSGLTEPGSDNNFSLPILVFWFTWRLRNQTKFNNVRFLAIIIIGRVKSHLELLYKANGFSAAEWKGDIDVTSTLGFFFPKPAIVNPQLIQCQQPSTGWLKLNPDGASKGNPGVAGVGGGEIIRDHRGHLVLAFCDYLEEQTNTYAKLYAVARGISLAKEVGCQQLWVEIDPLAVIHIINSDNENGAYNICLPRYGG